VAELRFGQRAQSALGPTRSISQETILTIQKISRHLHPGSAELSHGLDREGNLSMSSEFACLPASIMVKKEVLPLMELGIVR